MTINIKTNSLITLAYFKRLEQLGDRIAKQIIKDSKVILKLIDEELKNDKSRLL